MAGLVAQAGQSSRSRSRLRVVIRPAGVSGPEFEVVRTPEGAYFIRGEKPRRWVRRPTSPMRRRSATWPRLARLGVEEALAEAGATPGDEVLIGEDDDAVVFDWDPRWRPRRAHPRPARHGTPRLQDW